ncbi:MAG TPA: hypothetical protein HA349_01405 [Methanotrichaceae archaeon]|nr:hypothetical protein [Methanotrichaceae archaeon]
MVRVWVMEEMNGAGVVEIFSEYAHGLKDFQSFSHLILSLGRVPAESGAELPRRRGNVGRLGRGVQDHPPGGKIGPQ